MTNDEFYAEFLPALLGRFGVLDQVFNDDAKASAETKKAWYRILKYVDIASAVAALDAMFENPSLKPKAWDEYPSAIRNLARKQEFETVNRPPEPRLVRDESGHEQWVFTCLACRDTGMLVVWTRAAMVAQRYQSVFSPTAKTGLVDGRMSAFQVAVYCCCDYGSRLGKFSVRFDPQKHCRVDYDQPLESLVKPELFRVSRKLGMRGLSLVTQALAEF